MNEKLLLECSCSTPEHIVRFWAWPEDNEITLEYQLYQHNGFFKRLYHAFQYVFKCGKERPDQWDGTTLTIEEINKLYWLLKRFRENAKWSVNN